MHEQVVALGVNIKFGSSFSLFQTCTYNEFYFIFKVILLTDPASVFGTVWIYLCLNSKHGRLGMLCRHTLSINTNTVLTVTSLNLKQGSW